MNEVAQILNAMIESDPRAKLAQLEWEQLPNGVRNLPRLPPTRRRHVVTKVGGISRMTPDDWRAWGIR